MRKGDIDALKKLLKQYDEDGSALWLIPKHFSPFGKMNRATRQARS
jgi:hypothetical protein